MTEEEATLLGLVPFIDYYEFCDNGTCLSLRDMTLIGNVNGTVSLSGKIHTNTSKLSKIISVMFMGRRDMSRNIVVTNIDGNVTNNSVENLLIETRKEYYGRVDLDMSRKPCVPVSKRFYVTKSYKNQCMSEWQRTESK